MILSFQLLRHLMAKSDLSFKVRHGREQVCKIISTCKTYIFLNQKFEVNTSRVLITSGVMKDLKWVGPSFARMQIMMGLKGTAEELGLLARNYWIFSCDDGEK